MEKYINKNIITSIIVVIILTLIYRIFKKILNRLSKKVDSNVNKEHKKEMTIFRVVGNCCKYIFIILGLLIILQVNGVNVSSIIAGLGIVSVIIGLSLQDALKDIIMGFNIVVDDYFSIGDIVKIGEVEGKVINIGIKNTKILDIRTGNMFVTANRNITQSTLLSGQFGIDIPVAYEYSVEYIEGIINTIIDCIENSLTNIESIKYIGIGEFADSAVVYKLAIKCPPEEMLQAKRDILRILKIKLDEKNVEIPYNQIDIHSK